MSARLSCGASTRLKLIGWHARYGDAGGRDGRRQVDRPRRGCAGPTPTFGTSLASLPPSSPCSSAASTTPQAQQTMPSGPPRLGRAIPSDERRGWRLPSRGYQRRNCGSLRCRRRSLVATSCVWCASRATTSVRMAWRVWPMSSWPRTTRGLSKRARWRTASGTVVLKGGSASRPGA